jgi:hypothetical protein
LLGILATLVVILFIAIDSYLIQISGEYINSWVLSEAVAIQEGDLLSSFSKSQRFLSSSQFVKSIQIVEELPDQKAPSTLAEFGSSFLPEDLKIPKSVGMVEIRRTGFFKYLGFYRLANRNNVIIIFRIVPGFISKFYFMYCISLALLVTFFFFLMESNHRKEEEQRVSVIRAALTDLVVNGKPGPILARECPGLICFWDEMLETIETLKTKERQAFLRIQLGQMAAQVAHDIRSPLAALDMVLEEISSLPEDLRLIVRRAVGRIKDISNNLLVRVLTLFDGSVIALFDGLIRA